MIGIEPRHKSEKTLSKRMAGVKSEAGSGAMAASDHSRHKTAKFSSTKSNLNICIVFHEFVFHTRYRWYYF